MNTTVDFYYDFSSPNAYFAAMQLPPIAERRGATVRWLPIFLGGLFKAIGTGSTPGMASPEKAAHTLRDLERWARKHGLPFRFPSRFPVNTVKPLRAAIVLSGDPAAHAAFARAAFEAYWVADRDISAPDVVADVLSGLGHDAGAVLARTEEPEIKEALKTATDEARALGVFGAPTMAVGGELFWGKDRLEFVEDALAGAGARAER